MNQTEQRQKDYTLSVLAKNQSGVLLRIAGLFSRRCYNIKSIVAAQTEDEQYSEMIIVVQGSESSALPSLTGTRRLCGSTFC